MGHDLTREDTCKAGRLDSHGRFTHTRLVEAYLPFRHPLGRPPPVTEIRSTLIVSALQTFRTLGLFDRYIEAIAPHERERIRSLVPGEWLPIEVGLIHYRAADRLQLDLRTIDSIGATVADRINRGFLSVAVQLSKRVGATPWNALSLAHRFDGINWRGGDVAVWKLGKNEALYEWVGQPCASVPYFIHSSTSYIRALGGLLCEKALARPVFERCSPTSIVCRLSWI